MERLTSVCLASNRCNQHLNLCSRALQRPLQQEEDQGVRECQNRLTVDHKLASIVRPDAQIFLSPSLSTSKEKEGGRQQESSKLPY